MNMLLIFVIAGFLKAPCVSIRTAREEEQPFDWQVSGEMKVGNSYLQIERERENGKENYGYELKNEKEFGIVKTVSYAREHTAKDISVQKISIEPMFNKEIDKVIIRTSLGSMFRISDYDIDTYEYGIIGRCEVLYRFLNKPENLWGEISYFLLSQVVDVSAKLGVEGSYGFSGSKDIKVKAETDLKFTTLFGLSFSAWVENFNGKNNFQVKFSPMITF